FSSRGRHTRFSRDWSSDVCSSDLADFHESVILLDIFDSDSFQIEPTENDVPIALELGAGLHRTKLLVQSPLHLPRNDVQFWTRRILDRLPVVLVNEALFAFEWFDLYRNRMEQARIPHYLYEGLAGVAIPIGALYKWRMRRTSWSSVKPASPGALTRKSPP